MTMFGFILQPAQSDKKGRTLYKIACSSCGCLQRIGPMREKTLRAHLAGYEFILCADCARAYADPGYMRCIDFTFPDWYLMRKATPEDIAASQRAQLLRMQAMGELGPPTELGNFEPHSFYGVLLWGCEIGGLAARLEQLVCDTGFKTDIVFYNDHRDVFRVSPTADNQLNLYEMGKTKPVYRADFSARGLHEVITAARLLWEVST